MINKNYTIRIANRTEVDIAIEWAAKEGWNPGLYDAECYHSADSNGFLIGILGDEPIATISAIKYGKSFGFIGFYIVKEVYRGKGYGIQIWNAALNHLKGRIIGLDGVVAQQENYKKSGFKLAYRNLRYEGVSDGKTYNDPKIIKLPDLPFEEIESYDQPFFPEDRSLFIKSWINQPECTALGIMRSGKFSGYGVIRACRSGNKIGPLFADSPELAESLFLALRSTIKTGETIYLDTPEINQNAVVLAKRYNMKILFETARMYTGEIPDMPMYRFFGVTSFEVG